MPSSIPKPHRHLPRSRELECPVCGNAHTPFSCLPAELDVEPLIAEIKRLLKRVDEWNPGWERMSATRALFETETWLERFRRIIAGLETEKDGRG